MVTVNIQTALIDAAKNAPSADARKGAATELTVRALRYLEKAPDLADLVYEAMLVWIEKCGQPRNGISDAEQLAGRHRYPKCVTSSNNARYALHGNFGLVVRGCPMVSRGAWVSCAFKQHVNYVHNEPLPAQVPTRRLVLVRPELKLENFLAVLALHPVPDRVSVEHPQK